jgi:prolipoprotein diacylglyceryltransferase
MQQIIGDFGTLDLDVFGWSIPLRIYGYGLMLVLGFLVSLAVAQWRARRAGEDPEHMGRVGLLALVGGIVGSRVAYIVERWESHFARAEDRFAEMLDVTSGGLIYYGGVLLATAMVVAYLLRKRLPVRRYLDIVAAPLMIGLAFGRAGCTLNGCCYGARCSEHWPLGMCFPMYSRPLLKFDGRESPFSVGTQGPSPVYEHQLGQGLIVPPEALTNMAGTRGILANGAVSRQRWLLAARHLHGCLASDQTAVWADPNRRDLREAFDALAGADGLLNEEEFQRGRRRGDGLLRGSEQWEEAAVVATCLTFDEAYRYLSWRRDRFDVDRDGKLSPRERDAANRVIRFEQIGPQRGDQTVLWADPEEAPAARKAFDLLAGADLVLDRQEWQRGRAAGDGFLRGSERWGEALRFNRPVAEGLSFEEAYAYLLFRRDRFDADGDGTLSPPERQAANRFLQADQIQLTAQQRSLPVKPAQPLGLVNALVLAGLLGLFYRLRKREGQVFALLLILYPITRFVLEIIRADNVHNVLAADLTHNQYISMALTTIGMVTWFWLHRLPASAGPGGAQRQVAAAPARKKRKAT